MIAKYNVFWLLTSFRALAEIPPEPPPHRARIQNLPAVSLAAGMGDASGPVTNQDAETPHLAIAVNTPNRETQISARHSNPSRRGHRRTFSSKSKPMRDLDSVALRRELVSSPGENRSSQQTWHTAEASSVLEQGTTTSRTGYPRNVMLRLPRTNEDEFVLIQSDMALPSKQIADHLFEIYWTRSHVIFPWLDKDEFCHEYSSLWAGRHEMRMNGKSFYCILNLIFAIASTLDPAAESRSQPQLAANTYYNRAKKLMQRNLLDISHFQVLQTLLLAVQYLQSTKFSQQCLRTMGLAAWMAQDLGLHLPQTTRWIEDAHDRELVRKVWHGCVMLDR